jgi:hypothetical protein
VSGEIPFCKIDTYFSISRLATAFRPKRKLYLLPRECLGLQLLSPLPTSRGTWILTRLPACLIASEMGMFPRLTIRSVVLLSLRVVRCPLGLTLVSGNGNLIQQC